MQEDEEATGFLTSTKETQYSQNPYQISRIRTILPWTLTIFFASLSAFQFFFLSATTPIAGSYDTDFSMYNYRQKQKQKQKSDIF